MTVPPTTVLVVDDDADSRTILVQYLALAGLSTATATNGLEAIEQVRAVRPHVVLMDLSMPLMDGMEAIGRLKADATTHDTPIIVVTAHGAPALLNQAREAGAECGFIKPVDPRALVAAIAALVPAPTATTS
jgi:CheY-like chemotaxis protein